ncbi:MAG: hypothetical protein COA79_18605 [Planctomycetota bacterium]|nr:MAG: hypothetical protein COA79_18605 [Planctomycetota bacterium]
MRIISICNQKGGVGKTTTAVNIVSGLSMAGKTSLLVDLDPQTNASSYLGYRDNEPHKCSYTILENPSKINEVILKVNANLDLIPSSLSYLDDPGPREGDNPFDHLRESFEYLEKNYDYIIIDCPPSLGSYTFNAINTSQEIIIPVQCHYLSLEGLSQIVSLVDDISEVKKLKFTILLTMFEENEGLSEEIKSEIDKHFSNNLFKISIPYDITLAEAPSHEQSIFDYMPISCGAVAYAILVKEIIDGE